MLNILLSLVIGGILFAVVTVTSSWVGGLVLGILTALAAFILLSRRTASRIAAASASLEKHAQAGRPKQAMQELEGLRRFARWQIGLDKAIDGQIGALLYAHEQDFEKARPYLERAPMSSYHAKAMLAAGLYKARRYDEMEATFEKALLRNKKTSLLYAAYAWCEWKRNRRDHAIDILARGTAKLPSDERLKRNLLALQNNKKMKMNGWAAEWWALHLEKPPKVLARPPGGRRAFPVPR